VLPDGCREIIPPAPAASRPPVSAGLVPPAPAGSEPQPAVPAGLVPPAPAGSEPQPAVPARPVPPGPIRSLHQPASQTTFAASVSAATPVPTRRAPLGLVCAARSGDKGGNANIGVWTRDAAGYHWLREYLTTGRLRQLIPEAAQLPVRRYELANLNAVNFVLVGLLGEGVAASARPDPQAKGLGEYLRSRYADIPASLLNEA